MIGIGVVAMLVVIATVAGVVATNKSKTPKQGKIIKKNYNTNV